MTILYSTRAKSKKRAEQGHLGHFFPSILAGIDSRESLGLSALSAPDQQDPLENLSTEEDRAIDDKLHDFADQVEQEGA